MKINHISVTYGRKINLGDYNNANIEVTLGGELDENDELDQVLPFLWELAKENVKAQALSLVRKNRQVQRQAVQERTNGWQAYAQTNGKDASA